MVRARRAMARVLAASASIAVLITASTGQAQTSLDEQASLKQRVSIAPATPWTSYDTSPGGLIFLPAVVGGEAVQAEIDTGFPYSAVSKAYAVRHHLSLSPLAGGFSVGGWTDFSTAEIGPIDAADLHIQPGKVIVADLSFLQDTTGKVVDLVVGAAEIAATALEIDADNHRLRFVTSGKAQHSTSRIPLHLVGVNRMMTDLEIGGSKLAPVILDTGADSSLLLSESATPAVAKSISGSGTDVAAAGAGGIVVYRLVRVQNVRIGNTTIPSLTSTIEPPNNFASQSGALGLIGMGLLSRYNVVIDVRAGYIGLSIRSVPAVAPPVPTAGVQGIIKPDRIQIVHVMKNSPAAEAGIVAGQEICAVDAVRVTSTWLQSSVSNWGLSPPGTRHEVEFCDGKHLQLTSKSFF